MEEVFEIKQLANKGFGIVASKELQPGQLVLVEQAGVLGKVIYSKYILKLLLGTAIRVDRKWSVF